MISHQSDFIKAICTNLQSVKHIGNSDILNITVNQISRNKETPENHILKALGPPQILPQLFEAFKLHTHL